jgi:hypothetical protein
MLKYGEILSINNGNSKNLFSRNLTYKNTIFTQNASELSTITNNSTSDSSIQTTGNFNSATITDLAVKTISLIPNMLETNLIVNSPIAFSILKSEYQSNNFSLYPVFFSQNMFIENKNFILKTDNFIIKDNVIIINSENTSNYITDFQKDNLISGYIFPITDQNIATGYYSGMLYIPNSKLEKLNINSTFYKWTNNRYNYFTNQNKGFYKLKYLPQELNFSQYGNNMDSNYYDLVNNNQNLANLQANAIGLYDGEIIGMNNTNISFKLSDGVTIYETLNITKTDINILNNLALTFIDTLIIKDVNDNNYLSIGAINSLITFYKNIYLQNNDHTIQFTNILNFMVGSLNMAKFTASNNKIELFSTTLVNDLKVLSSFELNNIPITFLSTLNIIGNNNIFMTFNSVTNLINILQATYINTLLINNSFRLNNNIPLKFTTLMSIQDVNSIVFMNFNSITNLITIPIPTIVSLLSIDTNFQLLNDIPVLVATSFKIQNATTLLAIFNTTGFSTYSNIIFTTPAYPKIYYNPNHELTIGDSNGTIKLNLSNTVTIEGPNNGYMDISNCIMNSSFTITNSSAKDYNLTFIPKTKLYILSGLTQENGIFIFRCNNVLNINNMSGKITGTTWALNTLAVNAYDINIWSYPYNNNGHLEFKIGYTTLNQINQTNNGDWHINSIYLTEPELDGNYNLNIKVVGSSFDRVVWGFKVDILII